MVFQGVSSSGQTGPKKVKVGLSLNIVMVTVFGMHTVCMDYIEKKRPGRFEYLLCEPNVSVQGQFEKKKRAHLVKNEVLFHKGNARLQTFLELIPYSLYSPDLALFDFLQNLKSSLGGKRQGSNEKIFT